MFQLLLQVFPTLSAMGKGTRQKWHCVPLSADLLYCDRWGRGLWGAQQRLPLCGDVAALAVLPLGSSP